MDDQTQRPVSPVSGPEPVPPVPQGVTPPDAWQPVTELGSQPPPPENPPPPVAPPPVFSAPPPRTPPPPPLGPPPPLTPPPAGKPRGSGLIWKVIAAVALVLLAVSVAANFSTFSRGLTHRYGSRATVIERERVLEEIVVERTNSHNKIAMIELDGVIMNGSSDDGGLGIVESVREQLKAAGKDEDVKAVVLRVDSPGGEVLAADEIYRAVVEFQEKTRKPVVASMGSLAASGGYYVSAPCRWIVANELTITGSIGVIMHGYNYRGLMNKVGIRPEVFKSGKFKDMLSGDKEPDLDKLSPEEREVREQERKMVQDLIDETYLRFKKVVSEGRQRANKANGGQGQTLADDWAEYADGRVFSGKQAFELGFVDELGNFEKALKRARDLANIRSANVIKYREPFDLGLLFKLLGKTEAPSLKIDLGLSPTKLKAGNMYFISPLVVE